ncbi:MAG TPA: hypothetical protein VEL28_03515 [Candidatus Binatia bacterium]|nr:hypothetical protein [Candidatus Binatia bacterium]
MYEHRHALLDETITDSTPGYRTTSETNTCIVLSNGKDLNLNGRHILCDSPSGTCGTAVSGLAAGSILQGGAIDGGFEIGADNVEEVRNMTIDGAHTAVYAPNSGTLTRRVHGNVIRNVFEGIALGGATLPSTAYVMDNFLEAPRFLTGTALGYEYSYAGWAISICASTSGNGPRVEKNFIRNFGGPLLEQGDTGGGIVTVDCNFGTFVRVTDNILSNIADDADEILDFCAPDAVISGNICDDPAMCPTPDPPFVMP